MRLSQNVMVFLMSTCLLCHLMLAYYRQDEVTHIYCFIICLAISIFRWMKTKPYKISVNGENSLNVWMTLFKVTHLRLLIVIWLWKWILIINTCCDSWVQFVAKQEIFLFLNGKHTLHNLMTDFSWKCTLQSKLD